MEAELLDHRLGAPDAIAEALMDFCEGEDPPPFTYEQIEESCRALEAAVATGVINAGGLDEVDMAVLDDLVCGSTYVARCRGESRQKGAAAYRAGLSIAYKMVRAGLPRPYVPSN
jgi:hypothetical protein